MRSATSTDAPTCWRSCSRASTTTPPPTQWRCFGGPETLVSYGLVPSINPDKQEQWELAAALNHALPDGHRRFLARLRSSFACGITFSCTARHPAVASAGAGSAVDPGRLPAARGKTALAHTIIKPALARQPQRQGDLLGARRDVISETPPDPEGARTNSLCLRTQCGADPTSGRPT